MIQGFVGLNEIIEDVKTETGIENLRNMKPQLRKMIANAEKEINPYAGFLIKKTMIFNVGNGNFDGRSIKIPEDFVELSSLGDCEDHIPRDCYFPTVSHIVITDNTPRTKVTFVYWALQFDGAGDPLVTSNHSKAVVAYITYKLYSSKTFNGEGSLQQKIELKRNWEDLCDYSKGEDFFPSELALNQLYFTNQMSSMDFRNKTITDFCSCCSCSGLDGTGTSGNTINDEDIADEIAAQTKRVYFWQEASVVTDIADIAPLITDIYLATKDMQLLSVFQEGYIVSNPNIGRICFVIQEVESEIFVITDALNNDVTDLFQTLYDPILKTMLFVSINVYSHSSIYFKFK
jgi:hypothetical protein